MDPQLLQKIRCMSYQELLALRERYRKNGACDENKALVNICIKKYEQKMHEEAAQRQREAEENARRAQVEAEAQKRRDLEEQARLQEEAKIEKVVDKVVDGTVKVITKEEGELEAQHQKHIDTLEKQLAEKDKIIAQQEKVLEQQQQVIADQKETIASFNTAINVLELAKAYMKLAEEKANKASNNPSAFFKKPDNQAEEQPAPRVANSR